MALAVAKRGAIMRRARLAASAMVLVLLGAGAAQADFEGALTRLQGGDFARQCAIFRVWF